MKLEGYINHFKDFWFNRLFGEEPVTEVRLMDTDKRSLSVFLQKIFNFSIGFQLLESDSDLADHFIRSLNAERHVEGV